MILVTKNQGNIVDTKAPGELVNVTHVFLMWFVGTNNALNNQSLSVICHIWLPFSRAAMTVHKIGISLGP